MREKGLVVARVGGKVLLLRDRMRKLLCHDSEVLYPDCGVVTSTNAYSKIL